MVAKFLIALLVAYGANFASTHIVTSAHSELAFLTCVDSLTNAVQATLCPMYGQIGRSMGSMELLETLDSREAENRRSEFRNIINRCCSRPCSIAELVAVC